MRGRDQGQTGLNRLGRSGRVHTQDHKRQEIKDNWKLSEAGTADFIPAVVPGTVYTDLLREGRMEDPFWKDNEDQALRLMDKDYEPPAGNEKKKKSPSDEKKKINY